MNFLEYHEGCGASLGCFGPTDNYYTLFGTELRFLAPPIIISVLIGLCAYTILFLLRKRKIIEISTLPLFLIVIGISSLSLYFSITLFDIGTVRY